jgi:hypothetical protein
MVVDGNLVVLVGVFPRKERLQGGLNLNKEPAWLHRDFICSSQHPYLRGIVLARARARMRTVTDAAVPVAAFWLGRIAARLLVYNLVMVRSRAQPIVMALTAEKVRARA